MLKFRYKRVEYTYYPTNTTLELTFPGNINQVYFYSYVGGGTDVLNNFYSKKYLYLGKAGDAKNYAYTFDQSIYTFYKFSGIDLDLVEDLKEDRLIYNMLD